MIFDKNGITGKNKSQVKRLENGYNFEKSISISVA